MNFFTAAPKKADTAEVIPCPECAKNGKKIKDITVKAQLLKEKQTDMKTSLDQFYFCGTPECPVAYYSGVNDERFYETDIKAKVTVKNDDPSTPLCYCHKYKKSDALEDMKTMDPKALVKKIKAIISKDKSICQKANPKGSCCTEDIKQWLGSHGIPWETSIKLTPMAPNTPMQTKSC